MKNQRGMTLIELIIALSILAMVLSSLAVYSTQFARASSDSTTRGKAIELASDKIEIARSIGVYANLDTLARTESSITGFPGFIRTTQVTHTVVTGAGAMDYKTITVTVNAQPLESPVKITTIISTF